MNRSSEDESGEENSIWDNFSFPTITVNSNNSNLKPQRCELDLANLTVS